MGDLIEITTWPKHLNTFYKITSSALAFEIKASGNAAIGLSRKPTNNCDFWIVIGEGQQSWIKKTDSHRDIANTPGILTMEEYRRFWLTWSDGQVRLGRGSDTIVSSSNNVQGLKYVTFSVVEQRNPVHWRFESNNLLPPISKKIRHIGVTGGELKWVAYEPEKGIPEDALVGGFEQEPLFIARGKHRGSLTPGKMVPSSERAYVPWGGQANEKAEFEVLCGFDGTWVSTSEDKIPVGAFVAGYSEDALERLFIGRAEHEGHLIPGKVQPSHSACYISYEGREVAAKKYEVLVSLKDYERSVNKMYISNRVFYAPPAVEMEGYDYPESDYSNDTDEENVAL